MVVAFYSPGRSQLRASTGVRVPLGTASERRIIFLDGVPPRENVTHATRRRKGKSQSVDCMGNSYINITLRVAEQGIHDDQSNRKQFTAVDWRSTERADSSRPLAERRSHDPSRRTQPSFSACRSTPSP